MTSPQFSRLRPVYPGLDTMRAIASIAVVATHTCFWAGFYGTGLLGAMSSRLEVGVAIFFALSGFLLSEPYLMARFAERDHESARRYAWKRALRVLPVYWVAVFGAYALLDDNDHLGVHDLLSSLAMVDVVRHGFFPAGLSQMWSLAVEVTFYALLPILMRLLLFGRGWRPTRIVTLLVALTIASQVWTAIVADPERGAPVWAQLSLMTYFGWFAVGIVLAVLVVDQHSDRPLQAVQPVRHLAESASTCWMIALAALVVVSTPLGGPAALESRSPSESVWRNLLYGAIAVLVLLPSIFGSSKTQYAHVMGHPILRHLGHISYSLFCCHLIVLGLVFEVFDLTLFDTPTVPLFVGVLAVSLAVSEVLYFGVERPFLKAKDARWRRRDKSITTTPSEANARS